MSSCIKHPWYFYIVTSCVIHVECAVLECTSNFGDIIIEAHHCVSLKRFQSPQVNFVCSSITCFHFKELQLLSLSCCLSFCRNSLNLFVSCSQLTLHILHHCIRLRLASVQLGIQASDDEPFAVRFVLLFSPVVAWIKCCAEMYVVQFCNVAEM